MMKKIVLAASAAAVVLGAGTAALAASGSSSASPAASSSASSGSVSSGSVSSGSAGEPGPGSGHRPKLRALGRALHAQWVTRDRHHANAFVTHDAIRGAVTAVSASSITVKAEDGVSQTYTLTGTTKVRLRKDRPGGAGAAGAISDVHTGTKVAVLGTGTTSLTAEHILVRTK